MRAAGFTARFGISYIGGPTSNTSTRSQVNTSEGIESCRRCPQVSQKQYDIILERMIWDGRQEFNKQRQEISHQAEGLHQERLKFALLASEYFYASRVKLPVAAAFHVFAGGLKSGICPNVLSIYCASWRLRER